jgi:hypothetical protein
MVKSTKNQLLKEKIKPAVKNSKQSTIDDLSYQFNIQKRETSKSIKEIIIDQIRTINKENELALKIEFRLLPSNASFSKINLDIYFQEHLLKSKALGIPQSALLKENLEYPLILDMKEIGEGNYQIRVEMYETWPDEKLNFNSKEITAQYIPQSRESRLIKIPTIKSSPGSDLDIDSSEARNIYSEIRKDSKKEELSKSKLLRFIKEG